MTSIQKALIAAFLILGLGIRFYIAVSDRTLPEKDAAEYDRLAMNLVEGRGYRDAVGDLTAYRPPLYPMFLAGVYFVAGHNFQAARIAQALLSILTVFFIALWAATLFGGAAACFATAFAAVYPPFYAFYFSSSALITETLYTFLLTLAFAGLYGFLTSLKAWTAFVSGLAWGLSILTRPISLPLLGALPVILWISGYPLRQIVRYHLWAWVMAAAVLAPWILRNYRVFHTFLATSTHGGTSFYASNHPGSDGMGTHFYGNVVMVEWEKLREKGMPEPERSSYFFKKGLDFLRTHPREGLRLFVRKAFFYLEPFHTIEENGRSRRTVNWGYVLAVLASGIGFVRGLKNPEFRKPLVSLSLVFLYFIVFHAFFHAAYRYRLPTEPILILMASFAVMSFIKRQPALAELARDNAP